MKDTAFRQSYKESTAPSIFVLTAVYFKATYEKHHGIQSEVQHVCQDSCFYRPVKTPPLIALIFRKILMLILASKEIGMLLTKIQGMTQFLKKETKK